MRELMIDDDEEERGAQLCTGVHHHHHGCRSRGVHDGSRLGSDANPNLCEAFSTTHFRAMALQAAPATTFCSRGLLPASDVTTLTVCASVHCRSHEDHH